MTYAERLTRLVYWAVWGLIGAAALWAASRPFSRAPIDPRTGTAGLAVETDAGTGCDYLVTPWGGIVPRLGGDGTPLCRRPPR